MRPMDVLRAWGLEGAEISLWAERENRVFLVTQEGQKFALRQHRRGLRTKRQIEAELSWMAQLASHDIQVPRPLKPLVQEIDGQFYSILTWLPGQPLGHRQDPLALPQSIKTFQTLGALARQMHDLPQPESADRPLWDAEALVGEDPLWGRFWEHPALSAAEAANMRAFADEARDHLTKLNMPLQLIHADLLQENVLVDGDQVYAIDFDDSAVCYPLFDLTAPLVQRLPDSRFVELRDALLRGYGAVDREALALLFAIRCCTYMGWVQDKMASPEGKAMSDRIRTRAVAQVGLWQTGQSPILI